MILFSLVQRWRGNKMQEADRNRMQEAYRCQGIEVGCGYTWGDIRLWKVGNTSQDDVCSSLTPAIVTLLSFRSGTQTWGSTQASTWFLVSHEEPRIRRIGTGS